MSTISHNPLASINLKMTEELKEVIIQAAQLRMMSVNTYLTNLAYDNAKQVISEYETLKLSNEERDRFHYSTIHRNQLKRLKWLCVSIYPIPIARLIRLAVDKSAQRKGLGEWLVMDAFKRCVKLSKKIGIFGLVVDAKHERAKKFYFQYGFHELNAQSLTLFIPTKTIVAMMASN